MTDTDAPTGRDRATAGLANSCSQTIVNGIAKAEQAPGQDPASQGEGTVDLVPGSGDGDNEDELSDALSEKAGS